MLAAERHNFILQRGHAEGVLRTSSLAEELGVAEETIRRDLDKLAKSGVLERIHGGATMKDFVAREIAYADREVRQQEEKQAIAERALEVVTEGETILLDASSTCLQLAQLLPVERSLRVITYSLPVVDSLKSHRSIELVVLGGSYEAKGRRFGGLLTEQNLTTYGIDRFFFSAKGFHPDKGASEADEEQARLKTVGVRQSAWAGLLVDSTKLGVDSSYYFCRNYELNAVFSDSAGAVFFEECPLQGACELKLTI